VSVSVLVPYSPSCQQRERAWQFVREHYLSTFPDWELIEGSCDSEWSKGAAVADAYSRASGEALVLADADSYLTPPQVLRDAAVEMLNGERRWIVPHTWVYRLHRKATERLYHGAEPRRSEVRRNAYVGPPGGGMTVLTRDAYETVGGIDPRFRGWGGEDISFGWALETLVGPFQRLEGALWHLDHPHPAPKFRGTPETEALAGRYSEAANVPRLMRALIDGTEPEPAEPLETPVRFRSEKRERLVKSGSRKFVFKDHLYETSDPDEAVALRALTHRYQFEEVVSGSVRRHH
jgi:hypothetical protein